MGGASHLDGQPASGRLTGCAVKMYCIRVSHLVSALPGLQGSLSAIRASKLGRLFEVSVYQDILVWNPWVRSLCHETVLVHLACQVFRLLQDQTLQQ